jgi:pyrimidine-nucleoside phosphorylase
MVKIGKKCGRNMAALITNMDIPLGSNIGNALEIKEVIDILNNKGDKQLRELCLVLSATILSISYDWIYEEAYKKAEQSLNDGSAYKKFVEFVNAQGGNTDFTTLPVAKKIS